MNINETFRNGENILEKLRGVHIKLPMSHLPLNLEPIQFLDIVLLS